MFLKPERGRCPRDAVMLNLFQHPWCRAWGDRKGEINLIERSNAGWAEPVSAFELDPLTHRARWDGC